MASMPRPRGGIKRVPVPVRNPAPAPAPISIGTSSPSGASQAVLSSGLPSTQPPLTVHGQSRPRGPIPIVATNSEQPLPPHLAQGHRGHHHPQTLFLYTSHTIRMDPESQNHRSTLPSYLEEDIKAAVLASLPSNEALQPMRKRRTVNWRKGLRWTILSLSIALVLTEIVVSVLLGLDIPTYFAFAWGIILIIWNAWRLFRMKQKFDNERISKTHVGLEATVFLGCIAITTTVFIWSGNNYYSQRWFWDEAGQYDYLTKAYELLWRGVAIGIVLGLCGVFHAIVLSMTVIEKWTKPKHMHTALGAGDAQQQQQQLPPIIVQYMPTCPNCHGHEPRRSEDENSFLARIGDSQPQGVAPVAIAKHKEAMYTDETLSDYERYHGAAGVVRT